MKNKFSGLEQKLHFLHRKQVNEEKCIFKKGIKIYYQVNQFLCNINAMGTIVCG